MTYELEHLFIMCIFLLYIFSVEVSVHIFCLFFEFFVFPLLSFRNCLHIFDNSFISVVPNHFGTRNQSRGRQFSMDRWGLGGGGVCVWFGDDLRALHLLCTLFLLLHQLYLKSSGIRSQRLGPLFHQIYVLQRFSSSLWLVFSLSLTVSSEVQKA